MYSNIIKIAISVSLVGYLITRYGASEYIVRLEDVSIVWLLIACMFMTVSNIIGTAQWNIILRNLGIKIKFTRALAFYYTGLFFNNIFPSFIGGDIVRIYDIAKTSGKNSNAISTVFLDRLIGLFMLSLLAGIALIYSSGLLNSNFLIFTIVLIIAGVSSVLVFLYSKPFAKRFEAIGRKILPDRFHEKIREIYNSLNYFSNHPKLIMRLFLISAFVQTFRIMVHYCTAKSLGVDIGIEYYFLFIPIIALIITLPTSIAGIGVRETIGALLFAYVGVEEPTTVLFEGLAFLVFIVSSLPGGLAFVIRKHDNNSEEM